MQDAGEGVRVGEDDPQMIVGPELWRRRGKKGDWRGRVRNCSTALGKSQPCGGHLDPLFSGMSQHLSSCCVGTHMDWNGPWEAWLHKHSGGSTRAWQEPLSTGLSDRDSGLYMLMVVNKDFATDILKL